MTTIMPKIDFYIIKDNTDQARQHFSCKLIEKIYQLSHRTYVKVENKQDASRLDDLLWTFRDGSFIPHEVEHSNQAGSDPTPVVIGYHQPESQDYVPSGKFDVFVNLSSDDIPGLENFERVVEIVGGEEAIRVKARNRFRQYREKGYSLESHQV